MFYTFCDIMKFIGSEREKPLHRLHDIPERSPSSAWSLFMASCLAELDMNTLLMVDVLVDNLDRAKPVVLPTAPFQTK